MRILNPSFVSFVCMIYICGNLFQRTKCQAVDMKSFLISDYVQFHQFDHVCFLQNVGHRSCDSSHVSPEYWIQKTLRYLLEDEKSFNIITERKCSNDSATPFKPDSPLRNSIADTCTGVVIYEITSLEDMAVFSEVFAANENQLNWLLLNDIDLEKIIQNVYLPIDNKVTIALLSRRNNQTIYLNQAYQVSPKHPIKSSKTGNWLYNAHTDRFSTLQNYHQSFLSSNNSSDRLKDMPIVPTTKKLRFGTMKSTHYDLTLTRTDLFGYDFKCTTIQEAPDTILIDKEDGSVQVSGIYGELLSTLQEKLNFTLTCYRVKDGTYGSRYNGNWTGMVGEVLNGTADIAIAPIDITKERAEFINYLNTIRISKYIGVTKRPSLNDYTWNVYTKEFLPRVWITLISIIGLLMAALYLFSLVSPSQAKIKLSQSVFNIVEILFGQGTSLNMVSTCVRITGFVTLVFSLIVTAHYTTNLLSSLAARNPKRTISGLDDVNKNPSLHLGFIKHTSVEEFFKKSLLDSHKKAWQTVKAQGYSSLVSDYDSGIERTRKGKYMFVWSDLNIYYNSGNDCSIEILKSPMFTMHTTIVISKKSPFKTIINKVLLDMEEGGILSRLWESFTPKSQHDCQTESLEPLDFSAIFTAALLIVIFLILSIIIVVLERIYYKYSQVHK